MRKVKIIILMLIIVVMMFCLTGCFKYSDAAGYYEDDFGNWLLLEYDKPREGTYDGILCLDGNEENIFWEYDFDKEVLVITAYEFSGPQSMQFAFSDFYAHYEDGMISLEWPTGWYTFFKIENGATALSDVVTTPISVLATETPKGLSQEEADEMNGLFIMKDGRFYPFVAGDRISSNHSSIVSYDTMYHNVLFYDDEYEVLTLDEHAELVYFSDEGLPDYCSFFDVKDNGQAPMVYFYESYSGDSVYCSYAESAIFYESIEVEMINGVEVSADYLTEHMFDPAEICEAYECELGEALVYDVRTDETSPKELTISYFEGTQYLEKTFPIDYWYFLFDGCEAFVNWQYEQRCLDAVLTLTTDGYAVVELENIPDGMYAFGVRTQLGSPRKYYIIDIDRG